MTVTLTDTHKNESDLLITSDHISMMCNLKNLLVILLNHCRRRDQRSQIGNILLTCSGCFL